MGTTAAAEAKTETVTYRIGDQHYSEDFEFASDAEAIAEAKRWAESYEPSDATYWVAIQVNRVDGDGDTEYVDEVKITVEPVEPDCPAGNVHGWVQTDLRGNGGGVIITDTCDCGATRTKNTWAQNIDTGEQGLTSIRFGQVEA